ANEADVGKGSPRIGAAVEEEVIAGVVADDGVGRGRRIIAAINHAGQQAGAGELECITGGAAGQVLDLGEPGDQDRADRTGIGAKNRESPAGVVTCNQVAIVATAAAVDLAGQGAAGRESEGVIGQAAGQVLDAAEAS